MYLSRIALNAKRRKTMQAFTSPQLLHGAVEQSFKGSRRRNLWRIDWLSDVCYLLVLSTEQPDFTHIAEQFGYPDSERQWETRDYDPLLERLRAGQVWRFRLCANPIRSSSREKDESSGRGKVFAHVTQEQQKQWLLSRAETCGFTLEDSVFNVVHTQWYKFRKGKGSGREVKLRTATFEGALTISELDHFKQALLTGIGRAKAYGCGLLTIAHCGGSYNE
ncbi:MAG TPA: type I-E CRISPR-associated protein Cas6/Cse3/CasE [Bacteroidales bacterium]|nr:type I-E CRISPR-associated protein Cas6/Cse3/CasE [Syntrophaceticus schinkii]HHV03047.1 type I-E CRISPR-associated protein Cas6/Cse3/CasE [Bacteroidales bacterium]